MSKQNGKEEAPKDLRRQAREIADSLAIAFILAMVIRHYVLEVFKIPTKSMEPTLLGDPWTGDKILVNKFAYDFGEPERWQVAVFKYPEDTTKNYIKRVVGLPGETIRIMDGDVYINGHIARKPWAAQSDLWRLQPQSGNADSWQPLDPRYWRLTDKEFLVDSEVSPQPQAISYEREILAYPEVDARGRVYERIPTSDVMLQFYLLPLKMAGAVQVELAIDTAVGIPQSVDTWLVRIPLGEAESRPQLYRAGQAVATGQPATFAEGQPTLVQVCNVDRTILVRIGGRELIHHDYEPSRNIVEWPGYASQAHVLLACKQGRVAFTHVGVYVDVYYTDRPDTYAVRSPYTLEQGRFFMLGDNSINSNDSRKWNSVPESYLVGEAFLVLWPLGRMKLVR